LGVTALTFFYLIWYIFLQTPTAQLAAGGITQKIFYFHVPAATCGLYGSAAACFAGSVAYLAGATEGRNALARAGAEGAVVFGMMVLTTGPLWAKKAWGVYWTWDPRLTLAMLTVLIYAAVVVVRAFAGDGEAERKFAAALGVLGTVNIPLVRYAVQLWGGNHPVVIGKGGGGLKDPAMTHALNMGFLAFLLLCVLLLWLRHRSLMLRARGRAVEERALSSGRVSW
jgi:heme exporter protein C